jgi:hypothetical protein
MTSLPKLSCFCVILALILTASAEAKSPFLGGLGVPPGVAGGSGMIHCKTPLSGGLGIPGSIYTNWGFGSLGFPFWGYVPTFDQQYWLDYYRIPYFSKHPPVYYSYPVPRTYGYSPYAYPAGTRTPEIKPVGPIIQNKYVPQNAAATLDRVTAAPLRLKNPYLLGTGVESSLAAAGDNP